MSTTADTDVSGGRLEAHGFTTTAQIATVVLVVMLLVALAAPILPFHDPIAQAVDTRNAGPSGDHWLGTDLLGRDVLSRVVYGCRSAFAGIGMAVVPMLLIGIPWGLIAGFCGSVVDGFLMRIADAMLAFPALVLAIAVVSVLGPSLAHAMLSIGVICSPVIARLLRASVLPLRKAQYVLVARSLGCSAPLAVMRHVLPNALAPVLVQTFGLAARFLIIQSALGFLGLGSSPPAPSWGQDLADAYMYFSSEPLATVVPGVAITVGAWAVNTFGDGLRQVLRSRS